MLPVAILFVGVACLSFYCLLIFVFKLTVRDVKDVVIGFSRPLWGVSDKPFFLYELPNYGYESPSSSCELYGWRARSGTPGRLFDTFIFSTELDLLEIRLRELDGVATAWILVESDRTHTNQPKELWWTNKGRFEPRFKSYLDRIESVVVSGTDIDRSERFLRSGPYGLEALQRQAIMKGLHARGLEDGDVFITGDLDEIPRRGTAQLLRHCDLFPQDMTLHMPTFIGGFQFLSYEEEKRHTKVRMYRHDRIHPQWTSHHKKIGETLLLNAGWHCSWCFATLNEFHFKMDAGVHFDRSKYSNVAGTSVVTDEELNARLCRGEPPLERTYARPESYTFHDVVHRWRSKWNIEARRIHRNMTAIDLPIALKTMKKSDQSSSTFSYLRPGGECQRPSNTDGSTNLILPTQHALRMK